MEKLERLFNMDVVVYAWSNFLIQERLSDYPINSVVEYLRKHNIVMELVNPYVINMLIKQKGVNFYDVMFQMRIDDGPELFLELVDKYKIMVVGNHFYWEYQNARNKEENIRKEGEKNERILEKIKPAFRRFYH